MSEVPQKAPVPFRYSAGSVGKEAPGLGLEEGRLVRHHGERTRARRGFPIDGDGAGVGVVERDVRVAARRSVPADA